MKRFCVLFLIILLLSSGCTYKRSLINVSDVTNIFLNYNIEEYEVKKEKYNIVIDALNDIEFNCDNEVNSHSDNSIEIKTKSETLIFYLEDDGSIIQEVDKKLYRYKTNDTACFDIFKEALGNLIFSGVIFKSDEWIISDIENNILFNINENNVDNIIISTGNEIYQINKSKIGVFVGMMNKISYQKSEEEESYTIGYPRYSYIISNDDCLIFSIFKARDESILLCVDEIDEDGIPFKFRYYYLDNNDFYNLYLEILGNDLQGDISNMNPSADWVSRFNDLHLNELKDCCGLE